MFAATNAPAALLLLLAGTTHGFSTVNTPKTKQPPMPFKWPVVGTLPDFMARGGADRLRQIYEVSQMHRIMQYNIMNMIEHLAHISIYHIVYIFFLLAGNVLRIRSSLRHVPHGRG